MKRIFVLLILMLTSCLFTKRPLSIHDKNILDTVSSNIKYSHIIKKSEKKGGYKIAKPIDGLEENTVAVDLDSSRSVSSGNSSEHYEVSPDYKNVKSEGTPIKKNSAIAPINIPAVLPITDSGKITYNIPDTMNIGKSYIIKVRIIRNHNKKNEEFELSKNSPIINIKTSGTMEVKIVDPSPENNKAFDLEKTNSDIQIIDTLDYTEWTFNLTPLRKGNFPIEIVSSIIINGNLKEKIYSQTIIVKSNTGYTINNFWSKYWQWIIGTILLPILLLIFKEKK